jgi:hypothetical protein
MMPSWAFYSLVVTGLLWVAAWSVTMSLILGTSVPKT